MIGLVDYHLQESTSINLTYPNLEIMKLATYYKTEENLFCRLIGLDETELEAYDKIYFFCEEHIENSIPPQFLRAKNVIFGGTAFTNNKYVPFENSLIDYTIPKVSIYKEFLKQKYQDGIKTKVISALLDNSYYRHYAGDQELPIPPILPKHKLILYDRDFFRPGWQEMITNIESHRPSSIVTIHPIRCTNLTDYFYIREKTKITRLNAIILDLNVPLNEVNYMLKKYAKYFLADIVSTSNVYLTLGDTFNSNFQYYKDFMYKLNLLYAFWSKQIPIKIYYDYPNIGINNPLEEISKLVVTWSANFKGKKTLNERIKSNQTMLDEQAHLFKFYPECKDLFEQNYIKLAERRFWRI